MVIFELPDKKLTSPLFFTRLQRTLVLQIGQQLSGLVFPLSGFKRGVTVPLNKALGKTALKINHYQQYSLGAEFLVEK